MLHVKENFLSCLLISTKKQELVNGMRTIKAMNFGKLDFITSLRSIARLMVEAMVLLAAIMPKLGILGR